MKSKLSISRAWDETRSQIAADGRLLLTVAFALIALPSVVLQFAAPNAGVTAAPQSIGEAILFILVTIIGIVGQLALIRLAIGPSLTVGESIRHGIRRTPAYLAAAILLLIGLMLLLIPVGFVMAAMGVQPDAEALPAGAWLVVLLFLALCLYLAARLILISPVASAEPVGPLTIIKRSWSLTAGNAGRLIGFLLLLLIAAMIVLAAVTVVTNLIITLIFGTPEPLTVGALIVALVAAVANAAVTTLFVVMLARIYVQLSGDAPLEPSVPSSGT